jgi:hypothetical protein
MELVLVWAVEVAWVSVYKLDTGSASAALVRSIWRRYSERPESQSHPK